MPISRSFLRLPLTGRVFQAEMAALLHFLVLAAWMASAAAAAGTTAYIGATLIDGTDQPALENAALIVADDRILAVGAAGEVEAPEDAERIFLNGKFIVPGFIDTHAHFMESARIHMDPVVRSLDKAITEADDIAWLKARMPYTLSRYLCSGVTTVVSLGGPTHIEFGARDLAATLEQAPRVLIAAGPISNSGLEWIFDDAPAVFAADTPEAMIALIRDFHSRGADAIKLGYIGELMGVETDMSPEAYAPVLRAAADEAHRLGLPVITHVMAKREFEAVLDTGLDAYAHLAFDEPIDDATVRQVVERDIAVAPTIAIFPRMIEVFERTLELSPIEQQCTDPEVLATYFDYPQGFLRRLMFQGIAWMYRFSFGDAQAVVGDSARRLHAAGGRLLIGSDAAHIGTPHGVALHVEMQMLEDAGIPPSALIQAATRNAAQFLRRPDLGTLEAGKLADFLVLGKDPRETIRNAQFIDWVVRGGQAHPQAQLRAGAEAAAAP